VICYTVGLTLGCLRRFDKDNSKMRQRQMQWAGLALALLGLAGCDAGLTTANLPAPQPIATASQSAPGNLPARQAIVNFVTAVERVEPIAEAVCRETTSGVPCDFTIVIDDRADQPANAFQSLDRNGRPILGFTLRLIADARNVDEIAFVLGHEAAHHIAGHIPQQKQGAQQGALLAGVLVAIGGGGQDAVEKAAQIGANVGARRFSKDFELEADALGALIARRAGFDALRGAAYFTRIPEPGNQFLGTHPPNAQRLATVRRVLAEQQ
jgi:Zn-dependent protease with chaperone function